jgi:hypothetical protein
MTGYRECLRATVATSAGPHGYTLTLWTSGAVASHAEGGPPGAPDALLLLLGAVVGFGLIGLAATGSLARPAAPAPAQAPIWACLHLPTVATAIALCHGLGTLLHGHVLWPVVGCVATGTFLLGSALQAAVAAARPVTP